MLPISEVIKNLLVEYIEDVENLNVQERAGVNTILVQVDACKEDIAKIIGRNGRNITALNTIVDAIAGKRKTRVHLHIVN